MMIPVLSGYFKTGLVVKFPTLIVAIGLLTSSLVSLACGLMLDTVKKHSDQFYELALNMLEMNKDNSMRGR